jgi:hypothetical protein
MVSPVPVRVACSSPIALHTLSSNEWRHACAFPCRNNALGRLVDKAPAQYTNAFRTVLFKMASEDFKYLEQKLDAAQTACRCNQLGCTAGSDLHGHAPPAAFHVSNQLMTEPSFCTPAVASLNPGHGLTSRTSLEDCFVPFSIEKVSKSFA